MEALPQRPGQLTLKEALTLIDSDKVQRFDVHYKVLVGKQKYSCYYSDWIEDEPEGTVEEFIMNNTEDKYGSFWLSINDEPGFYQLINEATREPI